MTVQPGGLYFFALVGLVVLERLVELALSTRNARRVAARGAVAGESNGFYALMVAAHTLFLVALPLEVLLLDRPFRLELAVVASAVVALAMALRYWAIAALGERWNTRVLVVPGEAAEVGGPYRFVRHPNYVAVVAEMIALPLVHGAWVTAIFATVANVFLLRARIRHEEAALARASDYESRLGDRPRFLPGASG